MKLSDLTVILVGCGQMGGAIVRGLVRSGYDPSRVVCVDSDRDREEALALELGARVGESTLRPREVARLYLIAVKPWYVEQVLKNRDFRADDTIVSVAAGLSLAALREWAGDAPNIIRSMPNTPCTIGRGVTGIFGGYGAPLALARELFESVGAVVELGREEQFNGLTAISGSGPAYVFTIIEALADGGVLMGLDRQTARSLAIETLVGSAMYAGASDVHTAELKDRVASPGGTTIAALRELERGNLRHTLIAAVEAAATRSANMGE